MSPKVSITIGAGQFAALTADPRTRCDMALLAARAAGIALRRSHVGVVCGLSEWRVDHHRTPYGVSLAGAVLLALQPEPTGDDDALTAAAAALGVSLAWMHGVEAGWAGELMDVRCLAALDADIYLDGYAAGEVLLAQYGYGFARQ